MKTEERCGNCFWFEKEGTIPLSNEIKQSVTPRVPEPLNYGRCTAPLGIESRYDFKTTSVSPCRAVDAEEKILFIPTTLRRPIKHKPV